jgi:hypothetical protein
VRLCVHPRVVFAGAAVPLKGVEFSAIKGKEIGVLAGRAAFDINPGKRSPRGRASCRAVQVVLAPLGAADAKQSLASRLVARVKGMSIPPLWHDPRSPPLFTGSRAS